MNIHTAIYNKENQEVYLKDLPVFRQAFFVASVFIITGVVLSLVVDIRFLFLPLLVAGGLLFSSLVGWCPMALFLQRMPWNKKRG